MSAVVSDLTSRAPWRVPDDPRVALVPVGTSYPPPGAAESPIVRGLRTAGELLGWSAEGRGAFGAVVPGGARVLVKPNWVLHRNLGSGGFEPLVTQPSLIRSVVDELLAGDAGEVTVGDAPVQGCDFEELIRASGLEGWSEEVRARDPRFRGVFDFRRTRTVEHEGWVDQRADQRDMEHFVLFDLAEESLLEPITVDGAFRVTMYDPAEMRRTHAPGRHQYLVAHEVMEADVLVNLPKLKTHKKAGVTCALKNLIGINGNKEFLPHHRVGGAAHGGDCYPGRSMLKRTLEYTYDLQNATDDRHAQRALTLASRALNRVVHMRGDRLGIEGSWSGNDTIWRTCLDLNRILLYGRPDGSMAHTPQRMVLNVVDAVVGGQGDGPLSPDPLPLGLLLASASSAATDWVGARLLGYAPERIPIAAHAFDGFNWPIAAFGPSDVRTEAPPGGLHDPVRPHSYPLGWLDAVADYQGR